MIYTDESHNRHDKLRTIAAPEQLQVESLRS